MIIMINFVMTSSYNITYPTTPDMTLTQYGSTCT